MSRFGAAAPASEGPATAELNAALRLCVAENLSGELVKSTLGRAFLSGLPTMPAPIEFPKAWVLMEFPVAGGASEALEPCAVSMSSGFGGTSAAATESGSAECALFSCCRTS